MNKPIQTARSHKRFGILGMIFICVIVNYVDRSCISVAAPALREELGIDSIVFGSDFPHGEGLAYPLQYVEAQLGGLSDDQVSAIMRDNLARFLGLEAR